MILNYLMYILMLAMGGYLIYLSKQIVNANVNTKYKKENYRKLYLYMGYTFIIFAVISFITRMTAPQYEFIMPFTMIIILIVLNKKYRK
ncbi:hypothetical protein BHU61_00715 [Macrococcus epidermidis]|uniref:DUF3784 domain-containing protein n=1 Tax=Macrococcus epidermidis TaxID=1902580 RepID=A0A327ZUD3_9STAP|nr:hypothetical protein [Macrococcus epidermidis]RAK46000.1 hypothetical protein BHU61_00715 [Macrococcus epidermidis]